MNNARFAPDRATYVQSHLTIAAVAMAAGMAILWFLGNPHIWTGAIGGLAAVAVRGWYLMDEELSHVWEMTSDTLTGPSGRTVPLTMLAKCRKIGSAVQLVTQSGDKHLIKFQSDPQAVVAKIDAARAAAGPDQ